MTFYEFGKTGDQKLYQLKMVSNILNHFEHGALLRCVETIPHPTKKTLLMRHTIPNIAFFGKLEPFMFVTEHMKFHSCVYSHRI